MKILIEAAGGLTSGYLIKSIKDAGHIVVGSDISAMNAGRYMCDEFLIFPKCSDPDLWPKVIDLLFATGINIVIPSLDEMMIGWAERKEFLFNKGINVIISPSETIRTFQDKWLTFLFFKQHYIPCPETSLEKDYLLTKPRWGRGSRDIIISEETIDMTDRISQEIAKGEEITVDVLFDADNNPVYIVPRNRLNVKDGKSTGGIVCKNDQIADYIKKMAAVIPFIGPVNFQCFVEGEMIQFIEINPRIAGGMALGFKATENWIPLLIDNIIDNKPISPLPVQYGMKMFRYYDECFIS